NYALLLFVAVMLLPIMDDYSASSILDYLASLVILGTKIVVQDHIEQQLPRAIVGERYRLMPAPLHDVANVVLEADVALEVKKKV
ncbi:MAG: hypothetical protein M3R00_07440, partial [Pseudomonadota bacterium]|nr:hypothetical protein [Pseudomonadota bacterium]